MENHLLHIKCRPLNVTIFITHVRSLRNGCHTNVQWVIDKKTYQREFSYKALVDISLGQGLKSFFFRIWTCCIFILRE